jgi:hypothetical protein
LPCKQGKSINLNYQREILTKKDCICPKLISPKAFKIITLKAGILFKTLFIQAIYRKIKKKPSKAVKVSSFPMLIAEIYT